MSRSELLVALDAAPAGLRTLRATVREWTHLGRQRAAFERSDAAGHSVRMTVMLTAVETRSGARPETTESVSRVWFVAPDRWRVEREHNALFLSDGGQRWEGFPHFVTERGTSPSLPDAPVLGELLLPAVLLGSYRVDDVAPAESFGRPCWTATATARAVPRHGALTMRPAALHGQVDPFVHQLVVDAEHGFVVARTTLLDGEPCSVVEITDLAVDGPIGDGVFRVPPVATIQTEVQERARLLREAGVDPEAVDLADESAVSRALGAAHGFGADRRDPATLARQFVPWGPPPPDEAAAEREIRAVFRHHNATSQDGRDLVNVQAGAGLVEPMTLAERRAPGVTRDNVAFAVEALRFVCPDEAVVWFSLEVDGQPSPLLRGRRGRAVRVDGHWLIERGTIAELLALAGVDVPPPPD